MLSMCVFRNTQSSTIQKNINELNLVSKVIFTLVFFIFAFIPFEEITNKIVQYILSKIVKPKPIPKIDIQNNGIPDESKTIVVIPTILKNKSKVIELFKKLEVYYLANKDKNIYFALLGDCTSGKNKDEKFDKEVIEQGKECAKNLSKKYKTNEDIIPKFSFVYRRRFWNGKEECYLGWERKRGLLTQFNEYILNNEENEFRANTLEDFKKETGLKRFPKIKYVITLDSDTELVLNSGLELIGAMSHVLNKPELNETKDCVVNGHALIQPRIGINLNSSRYNLFTKIFAGCGGIDSYTNAISDIYQDNFDEGIFTGKGIYDLEVFSKVLKNEIAENKVLSHDLLEGSYLRCGLATDIMLMDGYPSNYISFKERLHRWIRGDFQIYYWLKNYITDKKENKKKNPLNFLSKYKILDNLIRAIFPISTIVLFITFLICSLVFNLSITGPLLLVIISSSISTIIDLIDRILFFKEGVKYQKKFEPSINSFLASIIRGFISISTLPDKAFCSLDAMIRSIYRMKVSDKHLLEWITAEEAEEKNKEKNSIKVYYKKMIANAIIGGFTILIGIINLFRLNSLNIANDIFLETNNSMNSIYSISGCINLIIIILGTSWILNPLFMWYISKNQKDQKKIDELNSDEKNYLLELAKNTWQYFKDSINEKNNYLPPDNYQEDRKEKFIPRTSSTNIGLGLLAVITSYDLGFENLQDTLFLLNKMLESVEKLAKWNGHLYNWYNIENLQPLMPRYISTVDSGNFVSYVYILKSFYIEARNIIKNSTELNEEEKQKELELIPYWVDLKINEIPPANADFTKLYDYEKNIFSIGYNIEENKMTKSYYDLLASEARNASYVAIAKKDVPAKHWNSLNRTLTILDGYKGLISWSGTAFEYLMPDINLRSYKGSLLDESYKFMISSQKEYAKKLEIPWGFSETAFNMKDLNNNYQYKAIGIPWLGLKRGLEDDIVVTPYASALALPQFPKDVINNFRKIEKYNMLNKYGFYESLDFTPVRLRKGQEFEPVKTYMAHHQALILLSINNLFKDNILKKRFYDNPEMEAIDILLQERMPENMIITQEEKKKPEKIKYMDYENYALRSINKINTKIKEMNCISNGSYLVLMDEKREWI